VQRNHESSLFKPPLLPKPPSPLPAKSYSLPSVSAEVLESSGRPELVKPQEDSDAAQAEALRTIKKRLIKIYQKQIDLFAEQQQALLGDPDASSIAQIMPQLHAAFSRYAESRLPLVSRLSYLAGIPDTNPSNAPPRAGLRPVPKAQWLEANGIRAKLKVLDDAYSTEATQILAEAGKLAAKDRLALLQKVENFRREMMDRALKEAINPLQSRTRSATLRLKALPEISLPAQPGRSINLPVTETLPSPPQVEFEKSSESANISKEFLRRQLAIWAAINRYTVVQLPVGNARDATKDFEIWRKQQRVGP
jgi:hypothetical protein